MLWWLAHSLPLPLSLSFLLAVSLQPSPFSLFLPLCWNLSVLECSETDCQLPALSIGGGGRALVSVTHWVMSGTQPQGITLTLFSAHTHTTNSFPFPSLSSIKEEEGTKNLNWQGKVFFSSQDNLSMIQIMRHLILGLGHVNNVYIIQIKEIYK